MSRREPSRVNVDARARPPRLTIACSIGMRDRMLWVTSGYLRVIARRRADSEEAAV